jgi:hypothetical protein
MPYKNKEDRRAHYLANKQRILDGLRKHRLENPEKFSAYTRSYSSSVRGRHNCLKHALRRDKISETDLLWNFNFYSALLEDNECHYCLGPLCKTGGALDRIENDAGHVCYNVVPCCRKCNRIKGNDTSYEEMLLLVSALREIVRRKGFASA